MLLCCDAPNLQGSICPFFATSLPLPCFFLAPSCPKGHGRGRDRRGEERRGIERRGIERRGKERGGEEGAISSFFAPSLLLLCPFFAPYLSFFGPSLPLGQRGGKERRGRGRGCKDRRGKEGAFWADPAKKKKGRSKEGAKKEQRRGKLPHLSLPLLYLRLLSLPLPWPFGREGERRGMKGQGKGQEGARKGQGRRNKVAKKREIASSSVAPSPFAPSISPLLLLLLLDPVGPSRTQSDPPNGRF